MRRVDAPRKLVILSADKSLAAAYQNLAALLGIQLDHFAGVLELGYLGRLREYDAAIVHQDLQPLTGLELAEYLEKLFQSLPMVLLTKDPELGLNCVLFPNSIVACMCDDLDPQSVFDRALEAVTARQIPVLAVLEHV